MSWSEYFSNWYDALNNQDLGLMIGVIGLIIGVIGLLPLITKISRRRYTRSNNIDDHILENKKAITKARGYVPVRCAEGEYQIKNPELKGQGYDPEFFIKNTNTNTKETIQDVLLEKKGFRLFGYRWNRKNKRVILFGGPGTGKSLTLFKLYSQLYNPWKGWFRNRPHLILKSMKDWDKREWKSDAMLSEIRGSKDTHSRAKCILLLDGLDEYAERNRLSSKETIETTEELFNTFVGFKAVVISSRPLWVMPAMEGVAIIHILPWDQGQVQQSLKKRHRTKFPYLLNWNKEYQKVVHKLNENEGFLLHKICRRPLLLNYVNDLIQESYYLTKQDILDVVENSAVSDFFEDVSKDLHKGIPPDFSIPEIPCSSKNEMIERLDEEIKRLQGISDRILDWYKHGREELLKKSSQSGSLESYADIYKRLLANWHHREVRKITRVKRISKVYNSLINYALPILANKMAKEKRYDLTVNEVEKLVEKYLFSSNSTKKDIELILRTKETSAADLKLRPITRSVFKRYQGDKLRFLHKSFFDYYLAKFIFDHHESPFSRSRILELTAKSEAWMFYRDMCLKLPDQSYGEEIQQVYYNPKTDDLRSITLYWELLALGKSLPQLILTFKEDELNPKTWPTNKSLSNLKHVIWIESIYESKMKLFKKASNEVQWIAFEGHLQINNSKSRLTLKLSLETLLFARSKSKIISHFLDGKATNSVTINKLLRKKVGDSKGYPGWNSLDLVCAFNSPSVVRILIEAYSGFKNEWLEMQDEDGYTSLMLASSFNSPNAVKLLHHSYEGSTNKWLEMQSNRGLNALMFACEYNQENTVKLLLKAYKEPKNKWLGTKDHDGCTVLMVACQRNRVTTIMALLEAYKGSKNKWLEMQDNEGWTALMVACRHNSETAIRALLEAHKGSKKRWLETQDNEGWNALIFACQSNSKINVKLLMEAYKGNKNKWLETKNGEGWNALMVACNNNSASTITLLLNAYKGPKNKWLETKNDEDWHALMVACQSNSKDTVKLLIEAYKGNKNKWLETKNDEDWNALMIACHFNSASIIELLLNAYKGPKNKWLETHDQDGFDALTLSFCYQSGERFDKDYPVGYTIPTNSNDQKYQETNACEIVNLLLAAGKKVPAHWPGSDETLKEVALSYGHILTAELLPESFLKTSFNV